MDRSISVYVDRNDVTTMSHRHYADRLVSEFGERGDIRVVDSPATADVIHLNYLNPFGRVRNGKESVARHLKDLGTALAQYSEPLVVTEHGALQFSQILDPRLKEFPELGEPGLTDEIKTTAQKLLAKRADAIIAVSDWVADALEAGGIPPGKIHTVYHGVSDKFEDREPTADDPFVFHLSKYSEQKNPETILEVGERLSVPLVIAGHWWDEQVPDPPEGVEVRGYVSEKELIRLYNQASAFFFPSLYESFGLPIVESMACGTPVVGSDCGSVPEIIGDGGIHHSPYEVDLFVEDLEFIADDTNEDLKTAALDRAKQFSWEATASSTIDVYSGGL